MIEKLEKSTTYYKICRTTVIPLFDSLIKVCDHEWYPFRKGQMSANVALLSRINIPMLG